jgi:Transposase and inactivated derivatives
MDRYWLLTWTTYGTWLPGDQRGFVSQVDDGRGGKITRNRPQTPYDADWELLRRSMHASLKQAPIRLNHRQAEVVLAQFHQTAQLRQWQLIAAAAMANHCHVVVGVIGDPDPSQILRDFKSYASRSLNQNWPRPTAGTWWTESGSKRKLKDELAILTAAAYVRDQEFPLALWLLAEFMTEIGPPRRRA